MYCQRCGAKFDDDSRFCGNCGFERSSMGDSPAQVVEVTSEVARPADAGSDLPPSPAEPAQAPGGFATPKAIPGFEPAQSVPQATPFDWNKVLAVIVLIVAAAIWIPILTGSVTRWLGAPYVVVTVFAVRWAFDQF